MGAPSIGVQADTDLYLRLTWNHHAGRPTNSAISGFRAAQASQELRHLSYIEVKHIRSTSVSEHDPRAPEEQQLKRRGEAKGCVSCPRDGVPSMWQPARVLSPAPVGLNGREWGHIASNLGGGRPNRSVGVELCAWAASSMS
jgi:hypothetical protein